MANARFGNADRGGRQMASPRPKTRDAKDTLCRNVLIYGHCRYEDQGCAFNHEQHKNSPNSNDAHPTPRQAAPVSFRASPGRRLEPKATPGSGAVVPSPGMKATPCQISSDDASAPATTSPTEVAEALSVLAEKVEADQLRFRSVSERLSSLEETVDYLVSPNENAPPKMLSRNGSVTGYTNGHSANSSKKSFNVDSPSFTPAQLPGGKKSTFSTNATPFTPRGAASTANPVLPQDTGASLFKSSQFSDFAPQNYDLNTGSAANGSTDSSSLGYDPFTMSNVGHTLPTTGYNPYAEDHTNMAAGAAPYYAAQSAYTTPLQPLNYHLYNPITPSRESLQLFQRHVQEFFVPDNVREELTRKSEAARQVLPNSQLPSPSHYHTLVPIDNKVKPASGFFGYISWVYKASSKKTGNIYCLRRIEEHHFPSNRYGRAPPVQEKVLWSYLVQLASAVKVIHNAKLAARCIDVTKVILTDKNRVRLSACAVLDVLHFETQRQVEDLQQEDFFHLGKLILGIATNTLPRNIQDVWGSLDQLGRIYSQDLKDRISWLLSPTPQTPSASLNAQPKTAEQLLYDMAQHTADLLDIAFNANDENTAYLARELENGRLFRLAAKLGTINERPEFDGDPNWSETGERYTLKLFRDYVFHQVDANGNPVVDLGHIVTCLNKLDVGVDEKVYLTSRDNQTGFIVTYKELKKQIQTAFGDLLKGSSSSKQQSGGRAY
ncbi:hypothetical protein DL770_010561 [Monosporascus sp. CRB-9-2]|nr:hypothetical protein DL770_010561 [Monosporascus sp. CRB-9-2]